MPFGGRKGFDYKQPGDIITAREWNDLVSMAGKGVIGPNVVDMSDGYHIIEDDEGGDVQQVALNVALIESSVGVNPPYLYSGIQASWVPGVGLRTFIPISGGIDLGNNMFNILEIGLLGFGVAKIPNGTPVYFQADPDGSGDYFFSASFYRGTYG